MRYYLTIIALLFAFVVRGAEPLRQSFSLNSDWQLFPSSALDSDDAEHLSLPHSFDSNSEPMTYTREFYAPREWSDKRVFLRFGGVAGSAEVVLNGRYVGEHRGNFTAFTFEITDCLAYGSKNYLMVGVSPASRSDMLPTSSDIELYAGIYRDVEIVVAERDMISPLHYSSDGVFVEQHKITADSAEGVVRLYLSTAAEHPTVAVRIIDPSGYVAFEAEQRVQKYNTARGVELPFHFAFPELWSPENPQMYSVVAELMVDGKISDRVELKTGFRKITIGDDNRLNINDKAIAVRGVNMAHDRFGRRLVASHADIDSDLAIIRDLGANAIRSIAGPHDGYLYERCNEEGVLVWVDMPFMRSPLSLTDICYYPTQAFRGNGFEQLREIIAQNYNHPSVVMWGIFSLVWQRGDDPVSYVRELNELAHTLDSSRPTVAVSNSDGDINFVTDLIVLRQDVGLRRGSADDVEVWCRQLKGNAKFASLRYGVCYGEEGSVEHQTDDIKRSVRGEKLIPERRQTALHERYIAHIAEADIFWGVWLDNIFDYASPRRAYGVNQSGLVDFKREKRKDAYWLYRALWSAEPTLHIAEKRWTQRRDTLQQIKVYSSVGEPLLLMDDDTLKVREIAPRQYVADSVVVHRRATISAEAGDMSDKIGFRVGTFGALR